MTGLRGSGHNLEENRKANRVVDATQNIYAEFGDARLELYAENLNLGDAWTAWQIGCFGCEFELPDDAVNLGRKQIAETTRHLSEGKHFGLRKHSAERGL